MSLPPIDPNRNTSLTAVKEESIKRKRPVTPFPRKVSSGESSPSSFVLRETVFFPDILNVTDAEALERNFNTLSLGEAIAAQKARRSFSFEGSASRSSSRSSSRSGSIEPQPVKVRAVAGKVFSPRSVPLNLDIVLPCFGNTIPANVRKKSYISLSHHDIDRLWVTLVDEQKQSLVKVVTNTASARKGVHEPLDPNHPAIKAVEELIFDPETKKSWLFVIKHLKDNELENIQRHLLSLGYTIP